eukprot:TRINITY_DN28541_c0_g1_i1.p1 TRINITY_DN28541_c0_g1~~TRINITY_DN28541_c0_g1_i1.p1  ORF type:complete len:109 (+),score=11.23 TRINITY_DN28541_c0_g1_i1:58-384(+)
MKGEERSIDQELAVVTGCIEKVITPSLQYQHNKVGEWIKTIVENCMQELMQHKMQRKYIVHCTILQKSGAGLHTNTCCYWDNTSDGYFTHKTENKNMICVTTVYGLAL